MKNNAARVAAALAALVLATGAVAQTKKELVQKVLAMQQAEIELVARSVVERPAAQMAQDVGIAMQRQVPPEKREAMAREIQAEMKRYVDEAFPLARERAIRIAPSSIGVILEKEMSEDELKQLVAWLESPANKKYQSLGTTMRNDFVEKLLAEARPVIDPKVVALDARIRQIMGLPPISAASGPRAPGPATAPARAAPPAARASGR